MDQIIISVPNNRYNLKEFYIEISLRPLLNFLKQQNFSNELINLAKLLTVKIDELFW
jgi:hypothetical protein